MSKILLVEHEPVLRRFYEKELAQDGDVVRSTGDGGAAVREFERERPDVVILDAGPPPTDDLVVVERLLALDRTVPIVLNASCRTYAGEALGWAVDAYVDKSGDADELRSVVRALLRSRLFVDP